MPGQADIHIGLGGFMTRSSGCSETILVVDDDPLIREALRRQLRRAGYAMEAAESGSEALEYAKQSAADLAILDVRMPGLSGFETCRLLKAVEGWESVPVLVLTGGQEETDYQGALEAGADDFLTKPVLFQELVLRIHSLIRLKRLQTSLRDSVATIQAQQEVILRDKAMREKLEAFLLHDLRNPISSILLQAELELERTDRQPEATDAWGRILHHAERLKKLVAGWMDFMGTESVGLKLKRVKVDTRAFLEELVQRHSIWFQVRRLRGSVKVQEELAELSLDPAIMERVLGNLLENCIRYSPEGGEILLEARLGGEDVVHLELSDQGPGIPPLQRESIFDMYVQLEAASNQVSVRESRGLGLAFCRLAVEAHGGAIWAEDNPAGGTRFVIQVPART